MKLHPLAGSARFAFLAIALCVVLHPLRSAQLLPGVYGYGVDRGINPAGFGATSTIYEVTSLADDVANPPIGSLRWACNQSGPRIVVFRTSGVIDLKGNLAITNPNLTLAGQTAPSPGISIHNATLHVRANNVLVQHVRVRPGDRWTSISTGDRDGVRVSDPNNIVSNVVFDHCTFAWSLDELASTWNRWDNVTFNKCLFAEPLYASNHLDEGTLSNNQPKQVETLTSPAPTKSPTSITTTTTASSVAIGGNYHVVNTTADGQWIEYTVPILPHDEPRGGKHLNIVSVKGTNRARFRAEIRDWNNNIILNSGEIVDQYGAEAQHTWVSQQGITQSFIIPLDNQPGTSSNDYLKVRFIVSGRNANATGWKLGIDQISITDNHGMGPLFSSGEDAGGKLTMIGSIFAHCQERSPWANSKQFYFANNVVYNRRGRALHFGSSSWNDPIVAAVLGNTFIEGSAWNGSNSPIHNHDVPSGSQIHVGNASANAHNYGDDPSPPPMVDTDLNAFIWPTDTTAKTAGLSGVTPLTPANAYSAALLGAGARPADRDDQELRVIDEIANGAATTALGSRPGTIKHTVVQAGGWPAYPAISVTHSYPSSPNADSGNGYTNIEVWLQQKAAEVEGSSAVLVGYWPLNEGTGTTTADASGNGNNGSLNPAPAWTTGMLGNALNFDGTNDAVNIGSPAVLDNLPAISVAAWIRADTTGGGGKARIVAKSTGTAPVNGWHLCLEGTNALAFAVDYATTNLNVVSAANAFTLGNWHHVAATWNGSTSAANVNLYVDGVEVGSYATAQSAAGTRQDDAASVFFIGNESTAARTFDGVLDDVRVYQGVLSTAEIAALANAGPPPPGAFSLATPANSATGVSTTPTLDWGSSTGAATYTLTVDDNSNFSSPVIFDSTLTASQYAVASALAGATQYFWRVSAVNSGGSTAASNNDFSFTTVLPAPSGLNATPVSISQINLGWTDNSSNEDGFKIERKKGAAGTYAQIGTVAAGVTSYSDPNLGAGTQYYYRVRAYRGAIDSAFAAEANATTSEVTSGRQAHWKFDEGAGTLASDETANNTDGTLTNGPAWASGKIGGALDFDASNDVVTLGAAASLADLPALTITAWIKPDSVGEGGSPGRIVHKSTGTDAVSGWQFVTQNVNGPTIGFGVDYTGTNNVNLNRVAAADAILPFGQWRHVVVTWTGSATATNVKFYIDGVETSYGNTVNGVGTRASDTTTAAFIGNDNTGVRTFDGALDDVRIYNRVLTLAEIQAIHRAGL